MAESNEERIKRNNRRAALVVLVLSPVLLVAYLETGYWKAKRNREVPPTHPASDSGSTTCTRDEDCTPSHTCMHCGQCFSEHPQRTVDCKAECEHRPRCACLNGQCARAP